MSLKQEWLIKVLGVVVVLFLLFFKVEDVQAAGVCGVNVTCQGTGVVSLMDNCIPSADPGVCMVTSWTKYEYVCDPTTCQWGPFTQYLCTSRGPDLCVLEPSTVYFDCCPGAPVATCDIVTTPPVILSFDWYTPTQTQALLRWRPGTGGDSQQVMIGNPTSVSYNCRNLFNDPNFVNCIYNQGFLPKNQSSIAVPMSIFTPGTYYAVAVRNVAGTCSKKDTTFVTAPTCTPVAPVAPVLVAPAALAEISTGSATLFDWDPTTSFGTKCLPPNSNSYQINIPIDPPGVPVTWLNRNLNTQYYWTPTAADPDVIWCVRANNGQQTAQRCRRVCVEGGAVVGAWSACSDVTHQRTRTCTETCGTDDCASVPLVEDCQGSIRGTLFDASSIDVCPSFDLNTGYLVGLPAGSGIASKAFGLTDASSIPPHPWSPLSSVRTDANGNFAISVYPNATYQLSFDLLSDVYSLPPKLVCSGSGTLATVPDNQTGCTNQPCSVVNNMSFGFTRTFGGWWQVKGGSVHAEGGIMSSIPSSLPTEQSLILPNPTMGNKRGFLSYGITRADDFLGTNPAALVSSVLWEKQSSYQGPVYDYDFYNNRFNLFTVTPWNESDPIIYADGGRGYQIFKSSSSVNSFSYNATGGEKIILHVNGDVRITGNISVDNSSFLMIIASGSIIFDPSVTQAEGWFVADNISIPCKDTDGTAGCDTNDVQFQGIGTFIGWGNISLSRNMGSGNNTAPSELFTYSRDLYDNAPEPVKIYTKFYQPFIP